jgi:hypothetical protein
MLALLYLLFCCGVMLYLGIGFILGNELVCMGFVLKGGPRFTRGLTSYGPVNKSPCEAFLSH